MVCKLYHNESRGKKQKDGGLKELEEKSRQRNQGGHTAWGWKEDFFRPTFSHQLMKKSCCPWGSPQEPRAEELSSSID